MPRMKLEVPHTLNQDEALQRVQRMIHEAKALYASRIQALEEQWVENEGRFMLKVMGMTSEGTIVVNESVVRIESKIPLAAMVVKGQIEHGIRQQLGRLLS